LNGVLYFVATDQDKNPELWRSSGKSSNTEMIKGPFSDTNNLPPSYLMVFSGKLFFVVDDMVHGAELWRLD
jgi:ELWxxDGT repeat protein